MVFNGIFTSHSGEQESFNLDTRTFLPLVFVPCVLKNENRAQKHFMQCSLEFLMKCYISRLFCRHRIKFSRLWYALSFQIFKDWSAILIGNLVQLSTWYRTEFAEISARICRQKFFRHVFVVIQTACAHREIFSKSYWINPKSDFIYHFPVDLEPNRHSLVPNQAENSKKNPISVWFN